jgi:hypothetical protein
MQTAYVYAFKEIAKRFVANARRVRNAEFQEALARINPDIAESITEAYDLRSDLLGLIDDLRELADHPQAAEWASPASTFIEPSLIEEIRNTPSSKFDLGKVARLCEELNSSYAAGNYLAMSLPIRALINHVPPIFGHNTFEQVVSNAGRTVKALLRQLDESSRDIAELHTHALVRRKEPLPSRNQVEPHKPSVEVLLHEIIAYTAQAG